MFDLDFSIRDSLTSSSVDVTFFFNSTESDTVITVTENIEAYSGACACCGETIPEFLTIEHKNGRKGEKKKLTGAKMWMKLKSLGLAER